MPSIEDEGDVGRLKKQYGSKIGLIKEMFPEWSEVDILFALQETEGDESIAVTRIADGKFAWAVLRLRQPRQDFHTASHYFEMPYPNTTSALPYATHLCTLNASCRAASRLASD
jgi:hypothetical protein